MSDWQWGVALLCALCAIWALVKKLDEMHAVLKDVRESLHKIQTGRNSNDY